VCGGHFREARRFRGQNGKNLLGDALTVSKHIHSWADSDCQSDVGPRCFGPLLNYNNCSCWLGAFFSNLFAKVVHTYVPES
jgi:hypothetical protein